MTTLYHTGIIIFSVLVRIASLFNSKANLFIQGRKKIWKSLERINPKDKVIWVHCASLGEFEQGRPVIEKIKRDHQEYKILLTFFSPSGYEIRKNYEHADFITYLPLDTPRNAKQFISKVNPEKAIFVKYEFWYFLLRELHRKNVETHLISAVFRNDQFFFKWYGKKFRKMVGWFNHIFTQDKGSLNILKSYGHQNVSLSGDTRLDRVIGIVQKAKELPLIDRFKKDDLVLVAGSSWKQDEELIFRYYKEKGKPFKMIIAPHEVHPANIKRIQANLKEYSLVKYSEANNENTTKADILLIDSIGLLSSIYRYGDFAYIGGGFGKGIHNLLEAATWGLPVVFGPNHKKFKEAIELIENQGGFAISDYEELKNIFDRFTNDPQYLAKAGYSAEKYIIKNSGATEKIYKTIFQP